MFCFPRACGLHHLVNGAIAFGEEASAEAEGEIINRHCLLIGKQFGVIAVGRDERCVAHGRFSCRFDMHEHVAHGRMLGAQAIFHVVGDVVAFAHAQVAVH